MTQNTKFGLLVIGIYLVIGAWDLIILLDRSDLLSHENEITDSEAEKSDRHNRNEMGNDDKDALQKGKRALEATHGKPFQGPHQNQCPRGLSHRRSEERRVGKECRS